MKNYGFPKEIIIKPEDWTFGSSRGEVINPSGDWSSHLPKYEPQAENYETGGCTVWGGQNQIEMLIKFLTGIEPNYSERFNYILADVKSPDGQQPQITYGTFKNNGLIEADLLPTPTTYKEFITPKPMTESYLSKGREWLKTYVYNYYWVLDEKNDNQNEILKDALKYSPVGVSVTAWNQQSGLYIDKGRINNHWCVLFNFDGDKPVVFDSYDHSIKTLHPSHKISYAMGVTLKNREQEILNLYQKVLVLVSKWLGLVKEQQAQTPVVPIVEPTKPVEAPKETPKYDWSTPMKARHSVRIICDEEGLSVDLKNKVCATVGAESGWRTNATNKNTDGSMDWGIAQFNDGPMGVPPSKKYWIGPGKPLASAEEAMKNPEKCIRIMAREAKKGNLNLWYGFRHNHYKKYL